MKNNIVVIGSIALAIVSGGIGFWGGTKYFQSKMVSNFANRTGGRTMMLGQNGDTRTNGNRVAQGVPGQMEQRNSTGEVTAKDDKSLTIKLADGSSKIIILSDNTTYRHTTDSSLSDITLGMKVSTFGVPNADGSVIATNIQIDPIMMSPTPQNK